MIHDLPAHTGIRRILIIKWSALGDIVIASAVMEDIRRAFPTAEIDLNTMAPWDALFEHDPRFRRVFTVDLRRTERGLRGMRRWLRAVRAGRYDLIVDLQSNARARLLMALLRLTGARVPYRLGNHPGFGYNIYPAGLPAVIHAFDHLRASLRTAGIPTVTPRPVLHPGDTHHQRAAQLLREHRLNAGRYALFMPGCAAAHKLKRWGNARYIALARLLKEQGIVDKVALIGAKDELDDCREIAATCGPWVVNLCGETRVLDIVPLAASACLIVSNDTGTAHVAATSSAPMVVICGPTDPRRVKPLGDNVATEQAQLDCINCYRKECSHHSCMPLVTPGQVLTTLRRLLAAQGA